MLTIENSCTKALSCHIDNLKSIAYDGCDYAMLRYNRIEIIRLDEHLCPLETKRVTRCYSCIAFDMQEYCYYACDKEYPTQLYKLDMNFNHMDSFYISNHHKQSAHSISIHPTQPNIWLLYANELVCIDLLTSKQLHTICLDDNDKQYMDVIALEDGYMLSYRTKKHTYIDVHCFDCDKGKSYTIPEGYLLQAMVLLNVVCKDRTTAYTVQLILSACVTHEQFGCFLHITCGDEDPSPCPFPPRSCEEGKSEIIHSIALEEAGIAHILNAEGEKLQKVIASDASIEELLMVNDSVRKTITQIMLLESQLFSKLESLHCICADEDDRSLDES